MALKWVALILLTSTCGVTSQGNVMKTGEP